MHILHFKQNKNKNNKKKITCLHIPVLAYLKPNYFVSNAVLRDCRFEAVTILLLVEVCAS